MSKEKLFTDYLFILLFIASFFLSNHVFDLKQNILYILIKINKKLYSETR